MRRLILASIIGSLGVGLSAQAQQANPSQSNQAQIAAAANFKPYLQVKTVRGEENTIRVYFSPTCSYSRQYFPFFNNLGSSKPKAMTFQMTPLINKRDGMHYGLAYFAVEKYYPQYLKNFVEASFIAAQDKGIGTDNWVGIERIGRAAQLPVSLTGLIKQHQVELRNQVFANLQLQRDLQITNTPSVAIAGSYVVTPEFTQGDSQMFSQLVNGIVSMVN